MAIEWADILKIAATSSLAVWGLNHVLVYRATLERDARYLAQRLAIILERFSVDCATVISDNQNYELFGKHHEKLPALGSFPTDADWKAIDPALMERVMSMPNELEQADGAIRFQVDLEEGDEYEARGAEQAATDDQAAEQGLKAWSLACELRRRYKVPASRLLSTEKNYHWDFLAVLRRHSALRQSQLEERLRRPSPVPPGFTPPA